jgi:mannose-6-phosphate isomerase
MKLERRYVEKPWGRLHLPPIFDAPDGDRIGEVWFTNSADLPLLAKYIFTSERLSIQVHPSDEQARARGLPQGKTECWTIIDADPGATIGLGTTRQLSPDELRQAALDGSIEQFMDWHEVHAGDFYLVPPGTVHSIGGGISLLEFQQNADVTYRLYDYGRPRELHLDDGVAVADSAPYPPALSQRLTEGEERTLVDGPDFTLVYTNRDALPGRQRWVMPLSGKVQSGGDVALAGDCLLLGPGDELVCEDAWALIGSKG